MLFVVVFFYCPIIVTSPLKDPDEVIKVQRGEDVVLECWSFADAAVELLEWSRPELKPDYVFYHREQRSYGKYQHPSYKGRVELRDPEMKNGDVSVILKKVTFSDAGSYECVAKTERRVRQKFISLGVEQAARGTGDGENTTRERWRVGQIAAVVITVVVATVLLSLIITIIIVLNT